MTQPVIFANHTNPFAPSKSQTQLMNTYFSVTKSTHVTNAISKRNTLIANLREAEGIKAFYQLKIAQLEQSYVPIDRTDDRRELLRQKEQQKVELEAAMHEATDGYAELYSSLDVLNDYLNTTFRKLELINATAEIASELIVMKTELIKTEAQLVKLRADLTRLQNPHSHLWIFMRSEAERRIAETQRNIQKQEVLRMVCEGHMEKVIDAIEA